MSRYNSDTYYILNNNPRILIDTNALMDADSLRIFLSNTERFMRNSLHPRKIFIEKHVNRELHEKSESSDQYKKEAASKALEIIREYEDLFEIEDDAENHIQNVDRFADHPILINLLEHIREERQLLITKDGPLTKDVLKMNEYESFSDGSKITVAYINQEGNLQRSKETRFSSTNVCPKTFSKSNYSREVKKDINTMEDKTEQLVQSESSTHKNLSVHVRWFVVTAICSLATFFTGRNLKK